MPRPGGQHGATHPSGCGGGTHRGAQAAGRSCEVPPELGDRWLFEPCGIVPACVVYDTRGACRQVGTHRPGDGEHAHDCVEPNGGGTVMVQWGCPADTLRRTRTPAEGLDATCSIAWYFDDAGQRRRKPTGTA